MNPAFSFSLHGRPTQKSAKTEGEAIGRRDLLVQRGSGVGEGDSPDLVELGDLGAKLFELLVHRHRGGSGGHRRGSRGFERKGREEMSDERRECERGGVW